MSYCVFSVFLGQNGHILNDFLSSFAHSRVRRMFRLFNNLLIFLVKPLQLALQIASGLLYTTSICKDESCTFDFIAFTFKRILFSPDFFFWGLFPFFYNVEEQRVVVHHDVVAFEKTVLIFRLCLNSEHGCGTLLYRMQKAADFGSQALWKVLENALWIIYTVWLDWMDNPQVDLTSKETTIIFRGYEALCGSH